MRGTTFISVLVAGVGAGCATVVPLQTASAVPPGGYRLTGQLSTAPGCGGGSSPFGNCAVPSSTGLPTPEVRVQVRHGVRPGFDLGASLHADALFGAPSGDFVEGGLFVDGKAELWSRGLSGDRRQLISLGLGAGFNSEQGSLFANAATTNADVDLAVPVYYGYQLEGWELVASPRFVQRFSFGYTGDPNGPRSLSRASSLGLALGAISRGPHPFGAQVEYRAPIRALGEGLLTVGVSFGWEISPPSQE